MREDSVGGGGSPGSSGCCSPCYCPPPSWALPMLLSRLGHQYCGVKRDVWMCGLGYGLYTASRYKRIGGAAAAGLACQLALAHRQVCCMLYPAAAPEKFKKRGQKSAGCIQTCALTLTCGCRQHTCAVQPLHRHCCKTLQTQIHGWLLDCPYP